jgi:flagellin
MRCFSVVVGIDNNIPNLIARRFHSVNRMAVQQSLYKLISGRRINRGADDPAGLVAFEHLRSELAALEAETRTTVRQHLRASTADGALQGVSDLLREAQVLALETANTGGTTEAERQANQAQIGSILGTIDRLAGTTSFNGQNLLDGSATLSLGSTNLDIDFISISSLGESEIDGVMYHLSDLKSGGPLDSTGGNAADANTVIKAAMGEVATLRAKIGAFQKNAAEPRLNSLRVAIENLSAANSMILDTDYAAETSRLVRIKLLEHAARGAIGIAKCSHRHALALLRHGSRII